MLPMGSNSVSRNLPLQSPNIPTWMRHAASRTMPPVGFITICRTRTKATMLRSILLNDPTTKNSMTEEWMLKFSITRCTTFLTFMLASLLLIVAATADAEVHKKASPAGVYLLTPAQFPSDQTSIAGVRFGLLYGRNADVSGFDFGGGVSHTTGDLRGLSLNLINLVTEDAVGWQTSMANVTKGDVHGVQAGLLNLSHDAMGFQLGITNMAGGDGAGLGLGVGNVVDGDFSGLQLGLGNTASGEVRGFQIGLFDQMGDAKGGQLGLINSANSLTGLQLGAVETADRLKGVQFGTVNVANEARGFQLGIVNVAKEMKGIQIGVFNVIRKGGWLFVLPGINGSF